MHTFTPGAHRFLIERTNGGGLFGSMLLCEYVFGRKMGETEEIRCEHCGEVCQDEDVLEVFHRGCRLKALFPGCYETRGPLLIFDPALLAAQAKKGS